MTLNVKQYFFGFILGSIPNLFKISNKQNNFKTYHILYSILSFLFAIFLILIKEKLSISSYEVNTNFIYIFISGLFMSAGIIIPGVSSTVILMCFGVYYTYLEAISTINLSFLIPLILGIVLGSILFLILIKKMLNKFPSQTFYTIIGFVLGSTIIIIPNTFNITILLLFLLGFSITFRIKEKTVE